MPRIVFKIARSCHCQFKCNYLKNEKLFLNFLFHFWNLHHLLNILNEKMIVVANVFSNLQSVENLVRTLSKRRLFRACFDTQNVPKTCETSLKAIFSCFTIILREFDLENISPSDRLNLRGVC